MNMVVYIATNLDGYNRVYIDGGKTVQGFINEGFVDELIITRIPILLGEGIPLNRNIFRLFC